MARTKCYLKSYSTAFLDKYLLASHAIVSPINSLAFLVSTILNSLILITVMRRSRLRTPSTLLMMVIVVKDLLIVSILQPVTVYRSSLFILYNNFCYKFAVDDIRPFLIFLYRCVSLTAWVFISGDRWLAIRRPNSYRRLLTKKRVFTCALVIWVFSIVLSYLASWIMNTTERYLLVFAQFGLTCIIIAVLQICVYRSIKAHGNNISNMSSTQVTQEAIEHRVAATVAYSLVALAICYIPIIVVSILRSLGNNYFLLTAIWMEMLLLCNAAVNPVILLKTNLSLRREAKNLFICCWHQNATVPQPLSNAGGTSAFNITIGHA
ncbi:predicted protein [Nematostella vectensis]|uniref:G-protein coupled receptors family 1 profile domain-containing protein n=1 Tax=Nematostella vectensis TaxID=45351 RepID=A7SG21_NEMVE|nr:predicted protein [Nematostella vectensis]|eukprot:XP_001629425.1 predicted protein [Nematostella vectensis]